jgi:hypothetical protein
LGVLADHPEGLAATDVLKAVEQRVPPTPHEQADYPNHPGIRRFEKTVRFARIGPVKAGWLLKDKGQWSITDDGRTAYSSFTDPPSGSGTVGCGRTSAPSRHLTTPLPLSTRPSGSRGRRSSAFVHRDAEEDADVWRR